jgi:hypothetical protein
VEKWEREVKEAVPRALTKILRNVEDVCAFMDKAATKGRQILNVGILSKEVAKLGEGWAVAVNWRKSRLVRWLYGAARPTDEQGQAVSGERVITLEEPICPTCGALVAEGEDQSHHEKRGRKLPKGHKERQASVKPTAVKLAWLERVPRFCGHCGAALWTKARTFSKGKKIGNNPKNPRTPLAEFIAARYADRLYLLVSDEIHENKSTSSSPIPSSPVSARMDG